jgi:hypothetical protein
MDLSGGKKSNHRTASYKEDRIKAMAAIPVAWAIVTAATLLSGLSLVGSYQQASISSRTTTTAKHDRRRRRRRSRSRECN